MKQISALHIRAQVLQSIRSFFTGRGFLEVETPLCIPANAPEEHIDPVNIQSSWQLQTSPEICMKRLLCRGFNKIFQISHCWRADERGSRHLTEFTMLEWYRADADYRVLMEDCRHLLQSVAKDCIPDHKYSRYGHKIDPNRNWQHISVQEAFSHYAQADALDCVKNGSFDPLLTDLIEPAFEKIPVPVILYDYPADLASLAKIKADDSRFAERFELYLGGLELANGFGELSDPDEQRLRFKETNQQRVKSGRQAMPLPEKFLDELSALPPSAGIALGVDRLVMLTTGAETIDQVVAFTPESL